MNTKEAILKKLAENKGKFISGEFLRQELNISRTAVWKHMLKLREDGYPIEAISNRGYRLKGFQDIYDKSAIVSQLNTKTLGKKLFFLSEIDSTNNELKRLSAEGAEEGTTVVALKQLAGRGRRGRSWCSEDGKGIFMSVLLKPDIAPEEAQAITLAVSSAACKVIDSYTNVKPGIKWPNDILLQGKKVCGILTELSAEPDMINSIILGIGINVYGKKEDFPEDLREIATSLSEHTEIELSRSKIVANILKEIENLYLDFLEKGSTARFLNIWRCYSVTLGRDIIIHQGENVWQAKALDVLSNGRLLVETASSKRQAISSGEISIREVRENNI
ncbi:MAG: biotin--[acetyl-CoA-carboxylase] ligase [Ruminiclostridium sp.]|nr:biotin--[acetyl-CoA-carboxylase] ligase [Ruminiclostridium sp.]